MSQSKKKQNHKKLFIELKASPASLNYDLVVEILCGIENVQKVHNLSIWCLTMDKFALSVHIVAGKYYFLYAGLVHWLIKWAKYWLKSDFF